MSFYLKGGNMKRRDFLTTLSSLTAGLALAKHDLFAGVIAGNELQTNSSGNPGGIRIDSPCQGAVLHRRLKEPVVGCAEDANGKPLALKVNVTGEAPANAAVKVNGVTAGREGTTFAAEIELRQKVNEIVVTAEENGKSASESRIKVWWLKNSVPRYRFTVDDTIFFLRDIASKQYKSLFDDYFLGHMRNLHEKYGTKVALNLFYESENGFTLSDFPDRYKSEWRDNADWLRLLFHAKREFPDAPYKNAPPEELIADFRQVEREIKRFAGEESYLPTTVVHFGEIRPDAYKPFAGVGVTALSGYFRSESSYPVSYQIDEPRRAYLFDHDFLVDVDSGITFSKIDMVLNLTSLNRIVPTLEAALADPNTAEFIDLLTHEQYFWPFYKNYIPDHWDRLDRAFAFVTERGYRPVFINDPLADIG